MSWRLDLRDRVPYQHQGLGCPEFPIELRHGEHRCRVSVVLDSGAFRTIINGEDLEPLGFVVPDGGIHEGNAAALGAIRFTSALGSAIWGIPFVVEVVAAEGNEHEIEICGSATEISRNLLGRDFFARNTVAFSDRLEAVYLDSLKDRKAPAVVQID